MQTRQKERDPQSLNGSPAQLPESQTENGEFAPPGSPQGELDPGTLLLLQKTAGNAAVSRLVRDARAREAEPDADEELEEAPPAPPLREAPPAPVLSPFLDVGKPASTFGKAIGLSKEAADRVLSGAKSLAGKAADKAKDVAGKAVDAGKSAAGKALDVAKKVQQTSKQAVDKVVGVAKKIGSSAKAAADKVVGFGKGLAEKGKAALGKVTDFAKRVAEGPSKLIGKVADFAKKAAAGPKAALQKAFGFAKKLAAKPKELLSKAAEVAKKVGAGAKAVAQKALGFGKGLFEKGKAAFKKASSFAKGLFDKGKSLLAKAAGPFKSLLGKLLGFARGLVDKGKAALAGAKNLMKGLFDKGKSLFQRAADLVKKGVSAAKKIADKAAQAAKKVASGAKSIFEKAKEFAKKVAAGPKSLFDKVMAKAKEAAGGAKSFFEKLIGKAKQAGGKLLDFYKGVGQKAWGAVKSGAGKVWDFYKGLGQKAWGAVKGGAAKVGGFFGKVWGAVKAGAGKVGGFASNVWGAVKAGAGKVGGAVKAGAGTLWDLAKQAGAGAKSLFEKAVDFAKEKLGLGPKPAPGQPGAGKGGGAAGKPGGAPAKAKAGGTGARAGGGAGGGGAGGGGAPAVDGTGPSVNGDAPPAERKKLKPEEDPRFVAVKTKVEAVGTQAKAHAPAKAKAAEAQGAAKGPANEVASQAKGAQVEEMGAQQPGTFDKKAFIDAVKKAIEAAAPKNLEEVTEFKESGKAGQVKDQVGSMVGQNKEAAEKDIKEKTQEAPDTSKAEPKPVTPMADEKAGPKPAGVGASAAMPPPASAAEINLNKGPADINKEMEQAEINEETLATSNEPDMVKAVDEKKTAEKHSAEAPQAYRAEEAKILEGARGEADETAQAGLGGMHQSKVGALAKIGGDKGRTKSADETKRAKVATEMEAIYGKTKADVTKILDGLEPKVTKAFESGEKRARDAFESFVDAQMSAYKKKRYSGIRGKIRWASDKLFGMPDAVNAFYEKGKAQYLAQMEGVISDVADVVGKDLTAARTRIAEGRAEIKKYVAGLPKDLKKIGSEAEEKMSSQFEALESDVDSKQDELVSTIANKYVESSNALDSRIEEMKAENQGLVQKAFNAIKNAIGVILKLKDLIVNVIKKAISVIGDIIKAPIQFVKNFFGAIKAGLNKFIGNIEKHLLDGLLGWLTGALGGAGIKLPAKLDIMGVFDLVMQILGLTWANIRKKIVKHIGEPAMSRMESVVDWIKKLVTQGPAALWEFVSDKLSNLWDVVIGGIQDFLIGKIIKAGITWLLGLLNPAAALVKAVMALYNIVMFIIERGQAIAEFVNSVLDAVIDVARGNFGTVAGKIEDALAKALPLAIGFLASLLGLGGVSEKVKEVVGKVRKPIDKVLDKLIGGVVGKAKALFGKAGAWVKGKYEAGKKWVKGKATAIKEKFTRKGAPDERTPEQKQAALHAAIAEADTVAEADEQKDPQEADPKIVKKKLPALKTKYRLKELKLVEKDEAFHVEGKVNPNGTGRTWRRPADLPAWLKLTIKRNAAEAEWEHIFDGHWDGTPLGPNQQLRAVGNNTMFNGKTQRQIQAIVRGAYANVSEKLETQGDRIRVRGEYDGWLVEMWVNKATKFLESAYPIF